MQSTVALQRRKQMRRAIRVECQVVRERDFRLVGDETLDVSPHGLRVNLRRSVLTGESMIVSFKLPDSTRWIDADAHVVRVIHGRRPGERSRAVGLKFDGLDDDTRAYISQSVRGVPPPIPNRQRA